jgi:lipopolysaccharide/colanic/teichoic acid biosynthesis glycosyltransferase
VATNLSLLQAAQELPPGAADLAIGELAWLVRDRAPRPLAQSRRYQYAKRAIDILGSSAMLAAFSVPCVAIAAAIRLTSPGPVFYREERIGLGGRPFRICKFRSMYSNSAQVSAPNAGEWRTRKRLQDGRDPRITSIGGFLRRWSLDEIPQLFNVLRGEMSLIGPRPIVQSETEKYGQLLVFYQAAVPGLSGLWQVSGRSDLDYDKRMLLDAFYVQSWSLKSDLHLILRTIPAVLSRAGAR